MASANPASNGVLAGVLVAVLVAAAGCQDSDVSREVGARCDNALECDQRCLIGSGTYPGGFCSISCDDRDDCPANTTCAERDGGVCLFECEADRNCTFLGAGWRCVEADLRGGGIKVMVCRGS